MTGNDRVTATGPAAALVEEGLEQEPPMPVADAIPLFQTTLRQKITPYLPPPVVSAMRTIDSQIGPYIGPDASINVLGSLILAWLLWQVVRLVAGFSSSSASSSRAIQRDVADLDILPPDATTRHFDGTILLCGPSLAGKSTIFSWFIQGGSAAISTLSIPFTVRSIKSTTGFIELTSSNNTKTKIWRLLDTPGHWGPEKLLQVIPPDQVDRILLVVDSTQPVAGAADYIYAVLLAGGGSPRTAPTTLAKILIVCHKSKHPKAKNARRLKLQLRSEFERLNKLRGDDNINWEDLLNNNLAICSSSVLDKAVDMADVEAFCETGALPSSSSKK